MYSDSTTVYSDSFYTGPTNTLMLTTMQDPTSGEVVYTNEGDGDASRIYASDQALLLVDVNSDLGGYLYGLWADPLGVELPEIYGLIPDYTRHDIAMGGAFPSELVGDVDGTIPAQKDKHLGFSVQGMGTGVGVIYFLVTDGINQRMEIMSYSVDFPTKVTTYESIGTISLGTLNTTAIELLPPSSSYIPALNVSIIAVLVQDASGCYLNLYHTDTFDFIESIGDATTPVIDGNSSILEISHDPWGLLALTDTSDIYSISFDTN